MEVKPRDVGDDGGDSSNPEKLGGVAARLGGFVEGSAAGERTGGGGGDGGALERYALAPAAAVTSDRKGDAAGICGESNAVVTFVGIGCGDEGNDAFAGSASPPTRFASATLGVSGQSSDSVPSLARSELGAITFAGSVRVSASPPSSSSSSSSSLLTGAAADAGFAARAATFSSSGFGSSRAGNLAARFMMAELDRTSLTFCVSMAPMTESRTLPPHASLCSRLSPNAVRALARNIPVFLAHSSRSSRPKTIMSRSFPRHTLGNFRAALSLPAGASPIPPSGQCGCVHVGTRENGTPPYEGTPGKNPGAESFAARSVASARASGESARNASAFANAASRKRPRTRSPGVRATRVPNAPHPSRVHSTGSVVASSSESPVSARGSASSADGNSRAIGACTHAASVSPVSSSDISA